MQKLLVIGGGRWARVITQNLISITSGNLLVCCYSHHNTEDLLKWSKEQSLSNKQLYIFEHRPDDKSLRNVNAVIVVNSAQRHAESAKWMISKKIPTLIEKPMTLSVEETEKLIELAKNHKTLLAPAHVFLFADYIEKFRKILSNQKVEQFSIHWEDPSTENRYGEKKEFDPSIPLFTDWLPHVVSILAYLSNSSSIHLNNLKLQKGGADLEMNFKMDNIAVNIHLIRKGFKRIRKLAANLATGLHSLDFSNEEKVEIKGPTQVDFHKTLIGPLSNMLSSFLTYLSNQNDLRFANNFALLTNQAIDQVNHHYYEQKSRWLLKTLSSNGPENFYQEIHYCLREFYYQQNLRDENLITQNVDAILALNKVVWQNLLKKSLTESIGISMICAQIEA